MFSVSFVYYSPSTMIIIIIIVVVIPTIIEKHLN